MRYQARWSNGSWKTFDRERFANVETHPTQKIRGGEDGRAERSAPEVSQMSSCSNVMPSAAAIFSMLERRNESLASCFA